MSVAAAAAGSSSAAHNVAAGMAMQAPSASTMAPTVADGRRHSAAMYLLTAFFPWVGRHHQEWQRRIISVHSNPLLTSDLPVKYRPARSLSLVNCPSIRIRLSLRQRMSVPDPWTLHLGSKFRKAFVPGVRSPPRFYPLQPGRPASSSLCRYGGMRSGVQEPLGCSTGSLHGEVKRTVAGVAGFQAGCGHQN